MREDSRIYRTFEEFEREELRRMDAAGTSVDDMIDRFFEDEVDFDLVSARATSRLRDEDDDE